MDIATKKDFISMHYTTFNFLYKVKKFTNQFVENNHNKDFYGYIYEYMMDKGIDQGSAKDLGQFFTLYPIKRLVISLVKPKLNETFYDPACGSGGLLFLTIN